MEAFNFTTVIISFLLFIYLRGFIIKQSKKKKANEDHNCYTFDMRKMDTALRVHKDHVSAVYDLSSLN